MRLTEKKDSGGWCLRDVPWSDLKPGVVLTQKTWKKIYGALWKLKDYEDTGLSPEQIEIVKDDAQVTAKGMLKKVAELSAELDRIKRERGSDSMNIYFNKDGLADMYDDTYDIVIHCESAEDQEDARLALKNVRSWVPISERLPDPDEQVLLSFENCTFPMIGRYTVDDEDSGTFRVGDMDDSFVENGLFVNAWMPLPESYKE